MALDRTPRELHRRREVMDKVIRAILAWATLFGVLSLAAPAQSAAERQLVNAPELHDEIKVAPGTVTAVKDYFPSFLEYQDLVMFHSKFGYYSSGRVNFFEDYQTFPTVLAPYFGQMAAEQMFRMWQGMRRAGTLGPKELFTIAEFGAGNGLLAESILDYLGRQTRENPESRWPEFAAQVVYACYDRSPVLSKEQRERNARFGKRFEAREADATDPAAAIPPGTLKGVFLSNELPDAFSVHKVILGADGSAEVAFVAPSLPQSRWEEIRKQVPAAVAETVARGDRVIKDKFFSGRRDHTYLTRASFVALLEALVSTKGYEPAVQSLEFNELYIPARTVPELGEHLRRYARLYAIELARSERGVVTYINLGMEKYIQGAGRILRAGYVITLDYGSNWDGIMAQRLYPHLRTYGPGGRDTYDPYRGPTLNDLTTDVNFSVMDAEGRLAGLAPVYFGSQPALQYGTPISLTMPPPQRQSAELSEEFYSWVENFQTNYNYKLLVQQKEKTDAAYSYPAGNSERLSSDEEGLSAAQREKAAQIEKRLIAAPEPGPR